MIAGLVWDGHRWLPLSTWIRLNRITTTSKETNR